MKLNKKLSYQTEHAQHCKNTCSQYRQRTYTIFMCTLV